MKYILTVALLVLSLGVFAQENNSPAKFTEMKHAFGKIPQGKPVTTEFSFTNSGTKPLIIVTAEAGCGCTTPDYPKAPIMAGKKGVIKVTYDAANGGPFTKDINVKFAGMQLPVTLQITGEVEKKSK